MSDESHANGVVPASASSSAVSKKRKGTLAVTIVVFLWAFWMGWSGWKKLSPESQTNGSEQWEDKTIAPKVAGLRQQLAAIEARPMNSVDDYIANTLETSAIVDEGKGLTRQQMAMIARFKQVHQDNAADGRVADYMMKFTEKDEQLMYLLADEIKCAKDLQALPAAKRLSYYSANVPPIKEKEKQVMRDWFAIAEDAKANGVPLPSVEQSQVQQGKH